MICQYDYSKSFELAAAEVTNSWFTTNSGNCQGELYFELTHLADPVEDCDTSTLLNSNTPLDQLDPESDDTLVCLGNAILNDCSTASGIVESTNSLDVIYKVGKNFEDKCIIKVIYQSIDNIDPEDFGQAIELLTQLSEQYGECPIEKSLIDYNSDQPGALAYTNYINIGLEAINPNTVCTGSLFE
jgi:hypothetical protein